MNENLTLIEPLLADMKTISLEEMSAVKLMKRNDTKYVTNFPTLLRLLRLTHDDYFVQQVGASRLSNYNTLYWDFPADHHFYLIHEQGRKPRIKVRTRTYVDSNLTFVEVKRKDNHGRTRKRRVSVSQSGTLQQRSLEAADFLQSELGYGFESLVPTLTNQFSRITLVNRAKTERVTIDINLQLHNEETGFDQQLPNLVIIELKRDGRTHSPLHSLLRELRIMPSGFSKYVIGSALTNPALRQNELRERLRLISKIIGHPNSYMKEH